MNPQILSKLRTRKTKSREKQAGKERTAKGPFRDHPAAGFLTALLLWVFTVLLLNAEDIFWGTLSAEDGVRLAGDATFLLVSLLAMGLFLQISREGVLKRNKDILLMSAIALVSLIFGKAAYHLTAGSGLMEARNAQFLLPLAMAPLLATMLINAQVAVAMGLWTALVMGIMAEHGFAVAITGSVATLVAAKTAWRVRSRSKVVRSGLTIGLCEVACLFGVVTLGGAQPDAITVLHWAGLCVLSGVLSAIMVLFILPLFEGAFDITTDITLLDLSDMSHPLLQRLALEAPGTYHHSLVVANLAQAAADSIGANSLLTRVAAYYHDVGKLTKPSFFSENIQMQANPHDDLPPSMSTLVITAHVKEGLSLAMLYKLPGAVRNIIAEHHGTSLISYFHHKARAQLEFDADSFRGTTPPLNAKVEDGAFRYTGPKPSSRESAIICLADGIEAASRAMDKAGPSQIEGLVHAIIKARIEDGQLDNSSLTLKDIVTVRRSFVFSLTNMLHGRVPYPKDEDRDKQPSRNGKSQPIGSGEGGTKPDDQGPTA